MWSELAGDNHGKVPSSECSIVSKVTQGLLWGGHYRQFGMQGVAGSGWRAPQEGARPGGVSG